MVRERFLRMTFYGILHPSVQILHAAAASEQRARTPEHLTTSCFAFELGRIITVTTNSDLQKER